VAPVHYPNAIWDEDEQRMVCDGQVAEVPFTAPTSRRKVDHVDGRLIVRRVRRGASSSSADSIGWRVSDQRLPSHGAHPSPSHVRPTGRDRPRCGLVTAFIPAPHIARAALSAHSGRWSFTKLGGMGS
jgi:hypothetical protein